MMGLGRGAGWPTRGEVCASSATTRKRTRRGRLRAARRSTKERSMPKFWCSVILDRNSTRQATQRGVFRRVGHIDALGSTAPRRVSEAGPAPRCGGASAPGKERTQVMGFVIWTIVPSRAGCAKYGTIELKDGGRSWRHASQVLNSCMTARERASCTRTLLTRIRRPHRRGLALLRHVRRGNLHNLDERKLTNERQREESCRRGGRLRV